MKSSTNTLALTSDQVVELAITAVSMHCLYPDAEILDPIRACVEDIIDTNPDFVATVFDQVMEAHRDAPEETRERIERLRARQTTD